MVVLGGEESPDLVEKVKVAVRVRPFNKREIELKTKCVVSMNNDQTILAHTEKQTKNFAFDHCFYSCERDDPNYADQEEVFNHVGSGVLNNAFAGYNACIFAYGQTGSGKSYSMMGTPDQPGIIPRLCNKMFQRIGECTNETLSFKVEVSFMEIYNEKVRDLLDPKNSSKRPLKVREHKILGPMVDGLSVLAVSSFEQIEKLIEEGNKCRTVAATNMNAESSRSHAVFNIRMTQILTDATNEFTGEKVSKISLVDLAGSERAQKTGAMGKRLEEGGNINKSLTTLGMVISALAEKANPKKEKFVPYRDSVLTWLLKDNLGGNSKTVMIATISPALDNYEETLSTLRYADRAKKIVNHAVVNEDPNAKIIRELREEVELLRSQITHTKEKENETEELRERLAESERLVEMMNKSWEDRLKETDTIYKERQKDLEEIGISVAGHGIKVEKDRYYLVNLNADPSLNELLVYYINKEAVIGSAEHTDEVKVDFLLQGLGVQPMHAVLKISDDDGKTLFIEPLKEGARICVNGRPIAARTPLRNGNRLLIGHNHFFRVNCPKMSAMDESTIFDYDDAWLEANSEANSNPIGNAVEQYIEQIEIKHKEDKQTALEKQYEEFSRYIHSLAQCMTPSTPVTPGNWNVATTPGCHLPPIAFPPAPKTSERVKFLTWAQRRDDQFKEGLSRLKTEIVRAQALVREANMMTAELKGRKRGQVYYDVTLQIPACNLRPSKIRDGNLVCEPVIVVKRTGMAGCQFMSIDQLENSLVDMREMYNEYGKMDQSMQEDDEDFGSEEDFPMGEMVLESQENHSLIGVANVFLEVLFHDVKLDYHVPIISQQGEVAGKLHIEVYRVPNGPYDLMSESTDSIESGSSRGDIASAFLGKTIRCRIRIKRATSLPSSLSHFVFCQYSFFGLSGDVVAPNFDPNALPSNKIHQPHSSMFQFDYEKDFDVLVTEEFLEYVQEDALSIEVWGHRSSGFDTELPSTQKDPLDVQQKNKGLQERWSEVTRRIEVWVDIRELNDFGEYVPVDVTNRTDEPCGGIYQLKQGQQRRIFVRIKDMDEHGILPLSFGTIHSVSIGSIMDINCDDDDYDEYEDEISLDSYQEEDLERIRAQWNDILEARQHYLEKQINKLSAKGMKKTEKEIEREKALINQWVALTEERNAVSVPPPNSNIPGSLSDWSPPSGVEQHVPVIFLDVNADDIAAEDDTGISTGRVAGTMSTLFGEDCVQMLELPILERDNVSAMCSWDSSIHENVHLNKVTPSDGRIYAIVKIVVRITHPISMDLLIRKRICLNVYKKPSLTGRLIKRIVGSDAVAGTGVHYNIVAHIPKSSLDMEDRETLAMMAAVHALSTDDDNESPKSNRCDTSYIEAYTKGIQAVECMLKLDRLRQESATFSMLSKHERGHHRLNGSFYGSSMRMKRAISLPNTMNNSARLSLPAENKLMEMSTTSSSGVSSMARPTFLDLKPLIASRMTSLVSPLMELGEARLSGIDEELHYSSKEPVRSSTVPETLASAVAALGKNAGSDRLNGNCMMDHSATSSEGLSSSTFSDSVISNSDEQLMLNNNVTTPKSLLISNLGDNHAAVADLEVNV